MSRCIPVLWLAVTLATACTSDAQTGATSPASAPPTAQATGAGDPLPSWNEGPTKKAIGDFVARVTKEGSRDFVPVPERIATFDNDGTLWAEKPLPFQVLFALERVKVLAPTHPEWSTKEPFASLLKGDMARVLASGSKGVAEILAVTHTGMTPDEFAPIVDQWITTAKHPQTGRLYTGLVYQPMVELLAFLRAINWYVEKRLCPHKKLLLAYIAENSTAESRQFFESLDAWQRCPAG
jgi:haloacid dehalogenase-like hydrolase